MRGEIVNRSIWKQAIAWSLVAACGWLVAVSPAEAEPRRNLNRGVVIDVPAAEAVLYEVTEKMYLLDAAGNVVGPDLAVSRKADASLFGWARVGNPLCPVSELTTRAGVCSVTADGVDNISLWTGQGSVDGTFAVVVQDDNAADAPEYVLMNGSFTGKMDLSIRPLGRITGTFTASGGGSPVPFCGTFRLPFQVSSDGKRENPQRGFPTYYLADDGATLVPVQAPEKSIGMPTVRLELRFGPSCG